jgi:hypothetical protein
MEGERRRRDAEVMYGSDKNVPNSCMAFKIVLADLSLCALSTRDDFSISLCQHKVITDAEA